MAAPEQLLYWLAVRQLSERVLGRMPGGDFACTGKTYDAQAGAEKMAAILTAVLSGARTFANVGMTPTDEVFHLEGAVIDMEILAYAWRAGMGLAWEETPTVGIVREGRAEQTFMTHPTTMRFREEVWAPQVFTREGLNQWLADGSPSLASKAWRIARDRIAAHEYRPEKAVQRELDRLMAVAEKEL
jgi:trimethylamine:corrinoid methyltransferase-like protein